MRRRAPDDCSKLPHPLFAAQYLLMSTDHQQFSIQNQADAILQYAINHQMIIVRTYLDEGRSGLHLASRDGLQQLLADVQGGQAQYSVVLVNDVSRWGRFQDADESAYYEYQCKLAGVKIIYCEETFGEERGPFSTVLKSIKRVMAAEYSRELSCKVYRAHVNLAKMGFSQGGPPGYGLRRVSIDSSGKHLKPLKEGERKQRPSDRIIWAPGPRHEVQIVRRLFREYTQERRSFTSIASSLNAERIPGPWKEAWCYECVRQIIGNEKYMGRSVYNKVSRKLKGRPVRNPRDEWVCKENAFPAIIDEATFNLATERRSKRSRVLDDMICLNHAIRIWEFHGKLSVKVLRNQKRMFQDSECMGLTGKRFGGTKFLYALIGYEQTKKDGGAPADLKQLRETVLRRPRTIEWLQKNRPLFLKQLESIQD